MLDDKTTSSSQYVTSLNALAHSASSDSEAKYGGLIESSTVRIIRKDMIQLFAYIYNVAPSFSIIHSFISLIRIFQFFGPSVCANYISFWGSNSNVGTTISIISFFFHFFPPKSRESNTILFLYFFISCNIFVMSLLLFYSYYFKTYAKVPNFITIFISFYFALFSQILHPITIQLLFEKISKSLFIDKSIDNQFINLFILVFILSFFFFWILTVVSSQNLTFRPDSLLSVSLIPPRLIFYSTIFLTLIFSFNTYTTGKLHYILQFSGSILYLISSLIPFNYGGFVSRDISRSIFSSSITGFLLSLGIGFMEILNIKGSMIIIFSSTLLYLIIYMFSDLYFESKKIKHLEILDFIIVL